VSVSTEWRPSLNALLETLVKCVLDDNNAFTGLESHSVIQRPDPIATCSDARLLLAKTYFETEFMPLFAP
jgi:hypothetical protein